MKIGLYRSTSSKKRIILYCNYQAINYTNIIFLKFWILHVALFSLNLTYVCPALCLIKCIKSLFISIYQPPSFLTAALPFPSGVGAFSHDCGAVWLHGADGNQAECCSCGHLILTAVQRVITCDLVLPPLHVLD